MIFVAAFHISQPSESRSERILPGVLDTGPGKEVLINFSNSRSIFSGIGVRSRRVEEICLAVSEDNY